MDVDITQILVSVILALVLVLKVVAEMWGKKKGNASTQQTPATDELFFRKVKDVVEECLQDMPCYRDKASCSAVLRKEIDEMNKKLNDLT